MSAAATLLRALKLYSRPQYVAGVAKALLSDPKEFQRFGVGEHRLRCRPPSYIAQYRSIFLERAYAFDFDTEAPRILDLGANVGFSVAFFKTQYPKARVTAWEADPELFAVLRDNCEMNGFKDVELINKAAWIEDTKLKFLPNGLGGGRLTGSLGTQSGTCDYLEVDALDLEQWMVGRKFDLVKIDIEGAEASVMRHCMESFASSRFLAFEYHSIRDKLQDLGKILSMLEEKGYRYHIRPDEGIMSRFTTSKGPFDNQLFITAEKSPLE